MAYDKDGLTVRVTKLRKGGEIKEWLYQESNTLANMKAAAYFANARTTATSPGPVTHTTEIVTLIGSDGVSAPGYLSSAGTWLTAGGAAAISAVSGTADNTYDAAPTGEEQIINDLVTAVNALISALS